MTDFRHNLAAQLFGQDQLDLHMLQNAPDLLRLSELFNLPKPLGSFDKIAKPSLASTNNNNTIPTPTLPPTPKLIQQILSNSLQMGLLSLPPQHLLKDLPFASLPHHHPPPPQPPPQPINQAQLLGLQTPIGEIPMTFESANQSEIKPSVSSFQASKLLHSHLGSHSSNAVFQPTTTSFADQTQLSGFSRHHLTKQMARRHSERGQHTSTSTNTSNNLTDFIVTLNRNANSPSRNFDWKIGQHQIRSLHMQDTGTLVPSLIDGEVIMGFNVWGEKRLCLPHLFRFVLHDIDLQVIDEACTKLQITCTTCSPTQLNLLHARKILPRAVGSCGLIRKSDAERLTKYIRFKDVSIKNANKLLSVSSTLSMVYVNIEDDVESYFKSPTKPPTCLQDSNDLDGAIVGCDVDENSAQSDDHVIPVIHECFGRQLGLAYPHLYTEAQAKCIRCITCELFFSPEQFVGHTHIVTEVDNLNHWGFDSTNWRCYLRIYSGCHRLAGKKSNDKMLVEDDNDDDDNHHHHEKEQRKNLNLDKVTNSNTVETRRLLDEFKAKFAQPIKLPLSLNAALRSVGLCASSTSPKYMSSSRLFPALSPKTSNSTHDTCPVSNLFVKRIPIVDVSISSPNKQEFRFKKMTKNQQCTDQQQPVTNSTEFTKVPLPQLTLRRLWAPNDGQIKLPPFTKLLTCCEFKSLPEKFQTGPPTLLHSHRVVTHDEADQYDRNFIPNVCLQPPLGLEKSLCYFLNNRRCRRRKRVSNSLADDSLGVEYECDSIASKSPCDFQVLLSASSSSSSLCSMDQKPLPNSTWRNFNQLGNLKRKSIAKFVRRWIHFKSRSSEDLASSSVNEMGDSVKLVEQNGRSKSCPPIRQSIIVCNKHNIAPNLESNSKLSESNDTLMMKIDDEFVAQRNKAIAAAQAAKTAAQRTRPGLWTRHFTKLKNSDPNFMNLPNARPAEHRQFNTVDNNNHVARESAHENQIKRNNTNNMHGQSNTNKNKNNIPVVVINPMKNSLPTAVLALESIWADLVRHINEYTLAVESKSCMELARQRLFEQFISMQTCYATHIAQLMDENSKLQEKCNQLQAESSSHKTNLFCAPNAVDANLSCVESHNAVQRKTNSFPIFNSALTKCSVQPSGILPCQDGTRFQNNYGCVESRDKLIPWRNKQLSTCFDTYNQPESKIDELSLTNDYCNVSQHAHDETLTYPSPQTSKSTSYTYSINPRKLKNSFLCKSGPRKTFDNNSHNDEQNGNGYKLDISRHYDRGEESIWKVVRHNDIHFHVSPPTGQRLQADQEKDKEVGTKSNDWRRSIANTNNSYHSSNSSTPTALETDGLVSHVDDMSGCESSTNISAFVHDINTSSEKTAMKHNLSCQQQHQQQQQQPFNHQPKKRRTLHMPVCLKQRNWTDQTHT